MGSQGSCCNNQKPAHGSISEKMTNHIERYTQSLECYEEIDLDHLSFDPNDFLRKEIIDRNEFALLTKVEHKTSKEKFALREIDLVPGAYKEDDIIVLEQEIKLWAMCSHPHIELFYGYRYSAEKISILSEYNDWNLEDFLKHRFERENGDMSDRCIITIFLGLLNALMYLHKTFDYYYMNLCPENVLLSRGLEVVKLANFPSSNFIRQLFARKNVIAQEEYAAPEQRERFDEYLRGSKELVIQEIYTDLDQSKVDSFSLGFTILRCILPKVYPKKFKNYIMIMGFDQTVCKKYLEEAAGKIPLELRSSIRDMLSFNVKMRSDIEEVWDRFKMIYVKYAKCFSPPSNETFDVSRIDRMPTGDSKDISFNYDSDAKIEVYSEQDLTKFSKNKERLREASVLKLNLNKSIGSIKTLTLVTELIKEAGSVCEAFIDLRENALGPSQCKSLAKAFSYLRGVEIFFLNLEKNSITYEGLESILNSLNSLEQAKDIHLKLGHNNLNPDCAELVGQFLCQFHPTESITIDFERNGIGDLGFNSLAASVNEWVEVKTLNLNFKGNGICEDARERFLKYIESIRTCSLKT